jgi:hypothetical protein
MARHELQHAFAVGADRLMPAPPLRNNFEGGVDGSTITTTDLASGNNWTVITSTPQWSITNPAHGTMGMKCVDPVAGMGVRWDAMGQITGSVWATMNLQIPNNPSTFFRSMVFLDTGGSVRAAFEIQSTGIPRVHSGAATAAGTVAFPLAAMTRVELRGIANQGAGEVEAWWWPNAEGSGAPGDHIVLTGQTNGTEISQLFVGSLTTFPTAPFTSYYDDVTVTTKTYVGDTFTPIPFQGAGRNL